MPAFVNNGPNIPEKLLQEHEEGRVVFFCGAGISFPAHLPDFKGLVKYLYNKLGILPNTIQKSAIRSGQYDRAIGLLEAGVVGGRKTVRKEVEQRLTPNLVSSKETATHESLLTLARNRDGRIRLISTNFDRLFEEVISRKNHAVERFIAPLLPVPKNRWNGLIYLHGLLPTNPTTEGLDRLVLSSGDFGLAYLIERWAARFVSELFRNYTVCFIGYSINDPVLRYMMDALAADHMLGESVPEMYAFGSYSKGKEANEAEEWRAKNVTPILYKNHKNHVYLHKTIHEWADTYRDGVHGKKMIITQHATTSPLATSRSDFAVGRVLWALTDKQTAKYFAEMNPVPPLEWLEPLVERQFGHEDLVRFGVIPDRKSDTNLRFSFFRRPAPYTLADWMNIAGTGYLKSNWDEVMSQLAHWLLRHLGDPKLIIWLARQGGQVQIQFSQLIRYRILELDGLNYEGRQEELNEIQKHAPKAIPGPLMRPLWHLFLTGRLNSHMQYSNLYDLITRFNQDGLTPFLRIELRELLTPRVNIRESYLDEEVPSGARIPTRIKDIVEWDLVLSSEDVHDELRDIGNDPNWQKALPELLQDFTSLLRDALDLKKALGGANDKSDSSYIEQPSISEHPQNDDFPYWTALIDLTRDAWLAMVQVSPKQAKLVAKSWWQIPYPLFKRLSFFAATNSDLFSPDKAINWLLSDEHWWLWSIETKRETFRLLVSLVPKLSPEGIAKLEQAILQGPSREMYKDGIESSRLQQIIDNEIWVRLAKLESVNLELSPTAKSKLYELTQQNPQWELAADESDEFSIWIEKGANWRKFVTSPHEPNLLMNWLMQRRDEFLQEDDWHQRCRDDFSGSSEALRGLAEKDEWPVERWKEALQVWRDADLLQESWCNIPNVLIVAPDNVIIEISQSLSLWLKAEARVFDKNEELFFHLCRRVLTFEYESIFVTDHDPATVAINHPVGHVTQALINWWYRKDFNDAAGLSEPINSIFSELCDKQNNELRHGRVLLASHVISLFRVDEHWTKEFLLPLFDWQESAVEARSTWTGFLLSPRPYHPLLSAIKQHFLDTASHYNQLGKYAKRFAVFLTFIALNPSDTFTTKELARATRILPKKGLENSAQALAQTLESAGEQRGEFWKNRIRPYIDSVWPKHIESVSPKISSHLAHLCVVAQDSFPDAVEKLQHWLLPIDHPTHLVRLLHTTNLCEQFPKHSLKLLDAIIDDTFKWAHLELRQCLDKIRSTDNSLVHDPRFQRLANL